MKKDNKLPIRIFAALIALLLLCPVLFSCAGGTRSETEGTYAPTEASEAEPQKTEPSATGSPDESEPPHGTDDTVIDGPAPLMWHVTDGEGGELYLFGTIHLGDKRSDSVLRRVAPILEKCDALAVEFDSVAYSENLTQMMKDLTQYVLTDGSTVSDHMPEELYRDSYDLIKRAGLSPAIYSRYNLAWWSQLVDTALMMVCSELDEKKAMDNLLIRFAYDADIPVMDVESAEFQMALLNSFDDELYLLMIEDALNSIDTYGDDLNELYELWLSGDKDSLWEYLSLDTEVSEEDYTKEQIELLSDYTRRLLDDRNEGMLEKAISYLGSGQTVFVAVGAAHMANEKGLVNLLTEAGYSVEPVVY